MRVISQHCSEIRASGVTCVGHCESDEQLARLTCTRHTSCLTRTSSLCNTRPDCLQTRPSGLQTLLSTRVDTCLTHPGYPLTSHASGGEGTFSTRATPLEGNLTCAPVGNRVPSRQGATVRLARPPSARRRALPAGLKPAAPRVSARGELASAAASHLGPALFLAWLGERPPGAPGYLVSRKLSFPSSRGPSRGNLRPCGSPFRGS